MKTNKHAFLSEWHEKHKLTEKQIDLVFSRFYKGEKAVILLKELSIVRSRNRSFVEHFPPIFCNSFCRLCGFHLYAYRSDRAHYRKTQLPYNILTAQCEKCGHQENMNCECLDCHLRECEDRKILENNQKCIDEMEVEWLLQYKNTIRKICGISFSNPLLNEQAPYPQLQDRDVFAISKAFLSC